VAPFKNSMHASTNFLPFEVCLDFQSRATTEMPLILHMLVLAHHHHKQQADQSGVQNFPRTHTPVTDSLQITPYRSKQHHVSYLVSQQFQMLETGQLDDSRDSAVNVPSVGGRRRDASRSKQGGIGPKRKDVNLP
jgi:hypothetical protein